MRKKILVLCLSVLLIGGIAGSVQAYSTQAGFFFDGLDLDSGAVEYDRTLLVILMGETIEELLRPDQEYLGDFDSGIDVSFEFAPGEAEYIDLVLQNDVKIAVLAAGTSFATLDYDAIRNLEFTDEPFSVPVNSGALVAAWTSENRYFTLSEFQRDDWAVTVKVVEFRSGAIPEPGTLVLMGIGLLGLVGMKKWSKNHMKRTMMFLLVITGIALSIETSAQEVLHPLITIKKAGSGSGTVLAGEYTCDAWCPELSVPYLDQTAVILKVLPDPDSIFVRWETTDGESSQREIHLQPGDTVTAVFDRKDGPKPPEYVEKQVFVKLKHDVRPDAVLALHNQVGVTQVKTLDFIGAELWEISVSVEEALQVLKDSPALEYIEPNYVVSIDERIPNDPDFSRLWGLRNIGQTGGQSDADIDASEAWDIQTDGGIVVAVIDTGVDYTHPDLAANMWTNPGEIPHNGFDDDGNGYIDDIHGYDFANNDGDPFDDHSHGTHCAGTISGVGNNSIGITGVNWSAKIMALKFLKEDGRGNTFDAVRAVQYAMHMGVKITSNSWGGGGYSQALHDAIQAAGNAGSLFIAAAGNGGTDHIGDDNDVFPYYPSTYTLDNIIAVASTDHKDTRSYFSNYGVSSVDLGAPGSSIYSTLPGNRYGYFSGTSMATPHVSGAVSLIWTVAPAWSALQVKDTLLSTVDVIPALQNITVTGGRLNLSKALNTLPTTGYASVAQGVTVSPEPVVLGQDFTISFTLKEVRGISKTFEQVAIAILDAQDAFVFDFALYENVTIPANGVWSRTATSSLYATRPPGTYKAVIRGKVNGEWFDFDTVDSGVNPKTFQAVSPPLPAPTGVSASDGAYTDHVGITWNSVAGAAYYQVYRNTVDDSNSAVALGTWQSGASYDDSSATPGQTYYYWVKAAVDSAGANASDFSASDSGWRKIPVYVLSVTKTGTGTGTVTSIPSGIDCGDACEELYEENTKVTLSAFSDSGSTFGGWSGAGCSGTGACVLTMDATKTVTAAFALDALPITIAGYIRTANGTGIAGVLLDGLPDGPTTDGNGYYIASGTLTAGWSGTVTPQKTGYTFEPPTRSYNNVTEDLLNEDYTATPNIITISGHVRTSGGTGISGVLLDGFPDSPVTDGSGYYIASGTLTAGWSGTVTPQKTGYSFDPPDRSYDDVLTDLVNEDYTGMP